MRQATRIVRENNKTLTKDDLMRIEAEDILASRVFDDEGDGPGAGDNGEPDKKDDE